MTAIRDALEAAAAQFEGGDNEETVTAGDPGGAGGAEGVDAQPADVQQPDVAGGEPEVAADAADKEADSRARDPKGRFTPAEKAAADRKAAAVAVKPVVRPGARPGAVAATPATPVTPTETLKPPQSWKPAAREKFAALPPEVQQEVLRIDKEVRGVMQEAAPAKQGWEKFRQTVGPYMGQIQAEGGDPFSHIGELLRTSQALRTAPAQHKAKLVANIIRQFGVPIDMLDSVLAGEAPAEGHAQPQQPAFAPEDIDRRVEEKIKATVARAQEEKARREVEQFGSTHEHFEAVRPMMQAIMLSAHQRGVAMSMEDAYKRACWADDDIRPLVQRSEAVKAAPVSTQQARAAASSLKSQPTGSAAAGNSKPNSIRQALEASAAALSKR